MIAILVAAQEDDKDFLSELAHILGRHFITAPAHGQKPMAAGPRPELALCDLKSFRATQADKVIVVYKSPQPIAANLEAACSAVAIVDSSDEGLLQHVSDTKLPAITCGLRSRDTITLSSMDTDSAVIDLRRSISCLSGSSVEPAEFPLRFETPLDSFLLMAVAAILILSGKMESLKEGFI